MTIAHDTVSGWADGGAGISFGASRPLKFVYAKLLLFWCSHLYGRAFYSAAHIMFKSAINKKRSNCL